MSVQGTATDLNLADNQPPVCVFFMTYDGGSFELYRGTAGRFGPHAFTKAKNPAKLTVQACFTEWTGMDERGTSTTVWQR